MNIEQNSFEQLFNIQCFGLMGKILADFMHMDKKKLFKFYQGEELWEKIMFKAIQYLKNVLDIQEILFSSRPHLSDEDISQIRQSFFQGIFQLLQTIFRIDAYSTKISFRTDQVIIY
ncbi:hypothetical protein PPERSA_04632 [Pseudocohnilembus persalinus]|uniref:Uncharacterized protein n=1 Tax=Pseudocohnilembus persalinus TaxID=266149 RepID=A0A0V0QNW3_PSEPJ|nr:hypothetical protein PPERSA_04632 [Pseudocohnilembus persalinus]|eukprot:KRX03837.1 hypothetical protein PPERSA_04632 [Pseudocohnilembus persalinus]